MWLISIDSRNLSSSLMRRRVSANIPTDAKELFRSISRISHSRNFVPKDIRDEFTTLVHIPGDVDDTYFTTSSTVKPGADASKQDLLNDLYTVRRICSKAQESSRLCRHEAAWNSTIHHPLLDLAFRAGGLCSQDPEQHAEVRVENITSATIVGDCIPRWSAAGDVHETATVGVWSVSQESAGNPSHESMSSLSSLEEEDPFSAAGPFDSTCHLDSTCHSKVGSKKADFALVVVPPPGSVLQTSIEVVLHHLEETPSALPIN